MCNTVIVTWECIAHAAELGNANNAPWDVPPGRPRFLGDQGNNVLVKLQQRQWTKRWAPKIGGSDKLFTAIFDVLQLLGRLGQVVVLATFHGKHPDEFKDYLDDSGTGAGYVSSEYWLSFPDVLANKLADNITSAQYNLIRRRAGLPIVRGR